MMDKKFGRMFHCPKQWSNHTYLVDRIPNKHMQDNLLNLFVKNKKNMIGIRKDEDYHNDFYENSMQLLFNIQF